MAESRLCMAYDLFQVLEYKDDSVFKTEELCRIWIPFEEEVPRQLDDVIFASTMELPQKRTNYITNVTKWVLEKGDEAFAAEIARLVNG